MDYLITEGYPSAAEKFAAEANIQPKADFTGIQERVQIRESIHRGDLQVAIELINELNPDVSFANSFQPPSLEMIRHVSCTTHSLRAEMRANNTFSPQYDPQPLLLVVFRAYLHFMR